MRLFLTLVVLAGIACAQSKYNGPRPPKPDVLFLLQAGKLIETESGEASQGTEKDFTVYTVKGATSPARTPVPEPVFLFQADKINPEKFSLFRMEVKGTNRLLSFPNTEKKRKEAPKPVYFLVTPLDRALFKVEVNDVIGNGEYCFSPDGSNTVFCFTTY
jgi:hypothetical protein